MAPRNRQIFTIGYEGKSIDEYIAELKEHRVALLCDVRNNPNSRKPGFAKKRLAERLERNGIAYRHFPELGIAREDRKNVVTPEDYRKLFDRYERRTLAKREETLGEIIALLADYPRIALTCFEADPQACHRSRIAGALERHRGYHKAVTHI